jgi:ribosomal protein S18 acetylase RimI-like enzyme
MPSSEPQKERPGTHTRKHIPQKEYTMAISVLPATPADTLALAQVETLAFDTPPAARLAAGAGSQDEPSPTLGRIMFGTPSAEKDASRAEELAEKLSSEQNRMYKAVLEGAEGEGKIVGFASWKFYTTPLPEEDTWQDLPWEYAANPTACNDFFGGLERMRTRIMGGRRFACMPHTLPSFYVCVLSERTVLGVLAIHPEHQGLGVGSKLLQRGLDDAAAVGLEEAFLEATDAGYGLYRKFGWRDVESFPLDLARYGGTGVCRTVAMRRVALA